VQVFTSLPPNVEGQIKFDLRLEISKINILADRPVRPEDDKSARPKQPQQQVRFQKTVADLKPDLPESESHLIAECLWWGEEETKGSIFRPKILVNGASLNSERKVQTTAKYVVRSGYKQFSAYLNGKNFTRKFLFNFKNFKKSLRFI
jgi:hypothetical protein